MFENGVKNTEPIPAAPMNTLVTYAVVTRSLCKDSDSGTNTGDCQDGEPSRFVGKGRELTIREAESKAVNAASDT